MQILYGTAMAAIFMLCLVLLWTARRILRSSPLTTGELSLTRLHEAIERINVSTESTETDYAEIAQFDIEPEVAEISTSLLDPIALEEMMAFASSVANETMPAPIAAQIQEPMQANMETPAPPQTEVLVEAADVVADREIKRGGFAKHLPHGYNYILEGLLLGVSVFVLIRTQRSTWRYHGSLQSSDQVA